LSVVSENQHMHDLTFLGQESACYLAYD
jgi:hypothetical protein